MKWTQELSGWLYPQRCPVCGDAVFREADEEAARICSGCEHIFQRICPPVCCRCGRPVEPDEELCTDCQGKRRSYLRGYPVWIYNQAMRESIAAFKYHGRREYAVYYAQEFVKLYAETLGRLHIQGLIPVPLYPGKYKSRGYNQAELFAEQIGKYLEIPVYSDYLVRIRNTVPQKELNDRQRYANLQKAFAVKEQTDTRFHSVMLVDDIYTTGSTIEACTRMLLRAGVKKVYFASVSIGS